MGATVVLGFPGEIGPELVDRVRAVAPGLNVLTVAYQDTPASRSARGGGDMDTALRETQPPSAEQASVFAQAEVILTFELPVGVGAAAADLRWVQGIGAGLDHWRGAALAPGVVTTSAAGIASAPIAEFVLARVLQVLKRLPEIDASQSQRVWQPAYGRRLAGMTMGVIGYGAIGSRVAALAHAFGMGVLATRRTPQPDEFATVYGADRLHDVLAESDVVVLAAPASDETFQLIDAKALGSMRDGAIFCNVARGSMVDEAALIEALRTGHLAAAILDVTAQEPLPAGSPLWDAPNLLLSPHSSASIDGYVDAVYALFCENLQRFLAGLPLRNQVDIQAAHVL